MFVAPFRDDIASIEYHLATTTSHDFSAPYLGSLNLVDQDAG
jgi:hypothetical protein